MMSKTMTSVVVLLMAVNLLVAGTTTSEYLGNNQRAGYADAEIPAAPVLQWTYREKHPPRHAWREPNREIQYIDFDYATQIAIGRGMVYFGSSADHKVYALDLHSGEEKWTFYTEGPVRFAPVVSGDRLYVVSDDGRLYCLKAETGQLIWKVRGGPTDDKLIGNDQMISHWPCRSGVLVEEDKLFFTAGMWSRDGVFIYCLDPRDGSVLWKNDTSGFHFMSMPHYSGFGGVAPQGYLLYHRGMLYVPTGRGAPACFDARTGETVRQYEFPVAKKHTRKMHQLLADIPAREGTGRIAWEYLGLAGHYILGTLGNETVIHPTRSGDKEHVAREPSRYIFAFDKNKGTLLWEQLVERSVSHPAIVADDACVYFLDRTRESLLMKSKRRGTGADEIVSSLKALDIATGALLWEREGIPPQCEALLLKNDVIVARPAPAQWQPKETSSGVAAYSSRNGNLLWQKEAIDGTIYMSRGTRVSDTAIVGVALYTPRAFNLHTGEEQLPRRDPLTGERQSFQLNAKSFCGTVAAGQDILTFRSACIGLKEISRDSGAFWFPETRPSCWISVIPAGGVLLAPEGYSTCICPYNYKTSLAMMPVERNEDWSIYLAGPTYGRKKQRAQKSRPAERIKTLRANLNAPGDRLDSDGNLWMSYPRPVESRRYDVTALPMERTGEAETFHYNSDYYAIEGAQRPRLYTSGFQGALKFEAQLSDDEKQTYTVRFHFAETEDVEPQGRVFDVKVQGKTVIPRLDVVAEAGGRNRALVKEVAGIPARGAMSIELTAVQGRAPMICAMEIVDQRAN